MVSLELVPVSIKYIEQDFWMSILLDVRIGLEINVLTSKFILLGDQMLGEMGCHPEICFYKKTCINIFKNLQVWFNQYIFRKIHNNWSQLESIR